ncbi:MAG: polymerase sigma-70 factor, subfamily [Gammaproteobacteria bacterium]|jgi:RNA polymerase sigma-70 factor (ECF subfamily)|nr:polymerase sigma-70 factor, subfamily [Gammaproteobacteria bacterium]
MSVPAKDSSKERDSELLIAIAGGSRQALGDLYLGYHRRLVRFLSRFTSSYENTEEIINDTFLVVWQTAKDFRFESQVSTWIVSIAYRTLTKSLRSQKNHLQVQSWGQSTEQSVDPTLNAEVQDWLTQGLSQLPVEQRLTLELAFHMGHSLHEIASITDCPVSTVKARLFHARAKLRHFLPALGGDAAGLPARDE